LQQIYAPCLASDIAPMSDHAWKLIAVVLMSTVAGGMNSIAGGGTLLTFPSLIGLGIPPLVANATSTVALCPGSFGSIVGYRDELAGARQWALGFAVPSLLGGGVGAWLLLRTPPTRFASLVPWLVLTATCLFIIQGPLMSALRRRRAEQGIAATRDEAELMRHRPAPWIVAGQFVLGIYGGYFGAGVGIVMLAGFGLMGLTNIHRMNGLKNWGGLCMNGVAAAMFAFSSLVNWPVALAMAAGAMTGGYAGSRVAQRIPQTYVRYMIIAIGLGGWLWLL
jgi:uncharacterized membrane protein YfcA